MKLEFLLIILFALSGIIVTSFLIMKRVKKSPVICLINEDCNKVLKSDWNHILYIYNDTAGLFYYILVLIEVLYLIFLSSKFLILIQIIAGVSFLISLFLLYIQGKILRNYCFYCILTLFINLFIFIEFLLLINN